MTCFINYIGLTLCYGGAYDVPPSGVYITSLPGLQIESIDKIATEEQITYLGVWDDVQKNAIAQLRIDVMAELRKCYKLNIECDFDELICDNIELLTISYKYLLGIWILLFRINSPRMNRYTTIDKTQAQELLAFYQAEYEKSINPAVQLFDASSCELCCGGSNPEVVVILP